MGGVKEYERFVYLKKKMEKEKPQKEETQDI